MNARKCHYLCLILWTLGLVGFPLSHFFLIARIEPFYTYIYSFLWWSLILSVDLAVYRLRGNSLLHDRPREFFLLALWSVPLWLLFEMLNLRLQNWYYVQAPVFWGDGFTMALIKACLFMVTAFATVLPGVFEIMEFIVGIGERMGQGRSVWMRRLAARVTSGRPFTVTNRNIAIQISLGVLMLVLTLLWPHDFFCLVWGFAFLMLDPICYLKKGRSLLGQLSKGDNTRIVALLLAGFITGLIWELWNLNARTKWIYTVPFFDELKIGEMPILGFLGFPPFVLECYAMVNFINLLRGGRNWELSAEENARRSGMPRRLVVAAWVAVLLFIPVSNLLIMYNTIASFSAPLPIIFQANMTDPDRDALRRIDVRHPHELLQYHAEFHQPPRGMNQQLYDRMVAVSRLGELKGMGTHYALILMRVGIRSPEDLAKYEPGEVRVMMARHTGWSRPREAWIKVWIQEARRIRP